MFTMFTRIQLPCWFPDFLSSKDELLFGPSRTLVVRTPF